MRLTALPWLVLLALAGGAGSAAAQVAAPSLNPTPTFVQSPFNAATLSWSGPTRIGASYGSSKLDVAGAPVSPAAKGKANGIEALAVGEVLAAGIVSSKVNFDFDPAIALSAVESSSTNGGVAIQLRKRVSFAVGYSKSTNKDPFTPMDEEDTLIYPSATARLGEWLYFGAGGGSEKVKDKLINQELSRSVQMFGAAAFWHEKDRGYHIEYFYAHHAAKQDATTGQSADEHRIKGGTVEFVFANFLLGATVQTDKTTDPAGVATGSEKSSTVSLGYTVAPGWAFVLSSARTEALSGAGTTNGKFSASNLGVAYQF